MHYYISWAAAEGPRAHDHYTERLVLLPAHGPHLYWSYRAQVKQGAGWGAWVGVFAAPPRGEARHVVQVV